MVGVPRSTGCQLCRSRRVKCDECHPECGNCTKYGVPCPGYDRDIKFVDRKHHIRQKGKRDGSHKVTSLSLGNRHVDSPTSIDLVSTSSAGSASTPTPVFVSSPWTSASLTLVSPSPSRALYIETMVQQLHGSLAQYDVAGIFHWIQLPRLGTRAVLDGAMCSLTMQLFGRDTGNQWLLTNSRMLYGQSLQALQASLQHPTEWKTSETLCSAILLCVYELFAGTASDSWLQHARGIGTLMEKRGPAAHINGWDAAMVLSFRGILIMSDMFYPTSDQYFLTRPEWKPIMRDGGRYLVHPWTTPISTIEVVDGFFENLADVPALARKGLLLRAAKANDMAVGQDKIQALAQLAAISRERFFRWHEAFTAAVLHTVPTEVLSEAEDSPYASVLEHGVPWTGSMHMSYWASMLIIQETLIECGCADEYRELQHEFLSNILRSIESVGRGVMGPYRVGYAIRIAYEFASTEKQEWIRHVLDGLSKRYAATDKATYPLPRDDDQGYV